MVKINLLPEKRAREAESIMSTVIVLAILLLVVILGMLYWSSVLGGRIDEMEAEKRRIQQEITELEAVVGKIEDYKKDRAELEKKLDIINTLSRNRTGPVRLMSDLSFAVPYDETVTQLPKRMWVENFEQSGTGAVSSFKLVGKALDNETISQFVINLENKPAFAKVRFEGSKLEKQNKTFQFVVTGQLDLSAKKSEDDAEPADNGQAPR